MMDSYLSRPSPTENQNNGALAAEFLDRGIEAFDRNERAMAWGWLHKAVAVCLSTNDQKGLAAAGWRLSLLKAQQGEVGEAIRLCRSARSAAEEVWSRLDMAQCTYVLGTLLCQDGQQEEGLKTLHSAVDLFGELNDVDGQLRAWRSIGGVLRKRGSLYEAIEAWKRCLVVYRQRSDHAGQARLHAAIARSWMRIGDLNETITHALAALGRHRHLESDRVEADLKLLSRLRRRMGDAEFIEGVSAHLDAEGVGVVVGMIADYDMRLERMRRAQELAEATSDLSEAEAALVNEPAAPLPPPTTAPVYREIGSSETVSSESAPYSGSRPSITLSAPDPMRALHAELDAHTDLIAHSDLDEFEDDTFPEWHNPRWYDSLLSQLPEQPWQIWVLAAFGTVIGMMTVMVILSVGAMIVGAR